MFWARFIGVSWSHCISVSPLLCHLGEHSKRRRQKCLWVTIIKTFFSPKWSVLYSLQSSLRFPEIILLSFSAVLSLQQPLWTGFCPWICHSRSVDWPPLLISKGLTASWFPLPPRLPRTFTSLYKYSIPWWLRWLRICLQCSKPGFDPWVRKIPWRREWQPTAIFLPGEFHGQRSLVGYSPWGRKELDMIEWLTFTLKIPYWLISSMILTLGCLSLVLSLDTCCKTQLCPRLFCSALPFSYLPVPNSHTLLFASLRTSWTRV